MWAAFGGQITNLYAATLTLPGWGDDSGKPELAESVTESEDGLSWTIKLREGLRFSDGSPLTAEDVKASLERLELMTWTVQFLTDTSSVEAVDDRTAVVHLTSPRPDLAEQLGQSYAAIFPKEGLAKGDSFWERPISAGRYQIDSMDLANGRFELTANPNYHGGEQDVKAITITTVPDGATRLAQVKKGEADYAYNVPANLASQVTGDMRLDNGWTPGNQLTCAFNFNDPVVGDVKVRKAMHLAVDRQGIVDQVFGGAEFARPLAGFPWNVEGEAPNVPVEAPDPAAAKELLKGTVCEDGCATKIAYGSDGLWQNSAFPPVLQQQLAEIGIDLELAPYASAVGGEVIEVQDFGLFCGHGTYFVDSANYIGQTLNGTNGSPVNDNSSKGFSKTSWAAKKAEFYERFKTASGQELDTLIAETDAYWDQERLLLPLAMLSTVNVTTLPESVITNVFDLYYVIP
jgi:ABC-type transport system substrate-binding protein